MNVNVKMNVVTVVKMFNSKGFVISLLMIFKIVVTNKYIIKIIIMRKKSIN